MVKNAHTNTTSVVFDVTFTTTSNAAVGPNNGQFVVGTDSVNLMFNVVVTPINNATNSTVSPDLANSYMTKETQTLII